MTTPTRHYTLNPPRSNRPAPATHVPEAEPTSHAAPARAPFQWPPTTDRQPLSTGERMALILVMAKAFKEFCRLDPDAVIYNKAQGNTKKELEDSFRHSHVKYATSHPAPHPAGIITGLSAASRGHFECLASHFCRLAGDDLAAFALALRDGPATGRAGQTGDQQSDIRQARAILDKEQEKLGFNPAYVAAIIANKFHQRSLGTLTRNEIWQVIFTLRNRAASRDGKSDPSRRNKSQTAAHKAQKAAGLATKNAKSTNPSL